MPELRATYALLHRWKFREDRTDILYYWGTFQGHMGDNLSLVQGLVTVLLL
jgi:hypothetical protein